MNYYPRDFSSSEYIEMKMLPRGAGIEQHFKENGYRCKYCNGFVNPDTLKCEYCDTQYVRDLSRPMEIITVKPGTQRMVARCTITDEMFKAMTNEEAEYIIKNQLANEFMPAVKDCMRIEESHNIRNMYRDYIAYLELVRR